MISKKQAFLAAFILLLLASTAFILLSRFAKPKVTLEGLKGVSLMPEAKVLSEVIHTLPHEVAEPFTLPDIDLHAYTPDGKHVGINYETGEYEIQIPLAEASGDLVNGEEWIFVPASVEVRWVVSAKDIEKFMEEFPEASKHTDGKEAYYIQLVYYDAEDNRYESPPIKQTISAGEFLEHPYEIRKEDSNFIVSISKGILWKGS